MGQKHIRLIIRVDDDRVNTAVRALSQFAQLHYVEIGQTTSDHSWVNGFEIQTEGEDTWTNV
jgi:hypothetical protein